MRVWPHLTRAPITEGVIDFRVRRGSARDSGDLEEITAKVAPEYVKKGPIVQLETNFSVTPEGGATAKTSSRELGIRLHSKDEKYVAQLQLEGFTLSRLAPYETWETLLGEARRLWTCYVQVAAPASVSRIATRFINNLQLPMQPGEHFESYLTKPPQIPGALPQGLLAFLQRVVVYHAEWDVHGSLTQVLQAGAWSERIPVILDIDVYRTAEFDPNGPEVWNCLSQLRDFKNLAFFESLTDKAIDLYR